MPSKRLDYITRALQLDELPVLEARNAKRLKEGLGRRMHVLDLGVETCLQFHLMTPTQVLVPGRGLLRGQGPERRRRFRN